MTRSQQLLLKDIADYLDAELIGDGGCLITGINTLQNAGAGQISFLANPQYKHYLESTKASAVIVTADDVSIAPCHALVVPNPYLSYARLTRLFAVDANRQRPGVIHPSAVVADSATVHPTAIIEANAVIADHVVVGGGSVVGANSFIGENTVIGDACTIAANVSIYHQVTIADQVVIHSGAVIGADGFGFAHDGESWVKIHQLGGVTIGNGVEIGACTTIDRGALDDTVIGDGVILDNHVQIAHNVVVGNNTAMAAQTGIAGSSTIGENCTLAGRTGVVGHIEICSGVHVTSGTIITKSIETPGSYSSGTGMTSTPIWRKNAARFNKLDELVRRLSELEKKIDRKS